MRFARLSATLLRVHKALYIGCGLTVLLTTLVVSSQVGLVAAFSDLNRVSVAGLSEEDVKWQLTGIRGILITLSTLTTIIASFLMWSAIENVVAQRLRESSLLRLVGASRHQLSWLSFTETLILSLIIAIPGAFLGVAASPLLFKFLKGIGFFGQGVDVTFGYPLPTAILIGCLISLVAAASSAAATASNLPRDVAVSPTTVNHGVGTLSTISRSLVVVGSIAVVTSIDPATGNPWLVLLTPFLAVVPLVAGAPFIIPLGAQVVGRLVGIFLPGAGRLASQRASRDRLRFARMGVPTIVCVGVLGGFLVANAPDQLMRNERNAERVLAEAVALTDSQAQGDLLYKQLGDQGDSARLASRRIRVDKRQRRAFFVDIDQVSRVLRTSVKDGRLDAVGGKQVASSLSSHGVGQEVSVVDRDGNVVLATVVATLDDPIHEGIFFNWDQLSVFTPSSVRLPTTVLTTIPFSDAKNRLGSIITASDQLFGRDQYVAYLSDLRAANTFRSNVGIFGTIYIMSIISLLQGSISSAYARRREFATLSAIGVGNSGSLATVLVESVIVQAVAGALVSLTVLGLGWQFSEANGTSFVAAILDISPTVAMAYVAVASVGIASQYLGAYLTLRTTTLSDSCDVSA